MKEKLNELLRKWEEISKQNGELQFCPDGLMNKGEVDYLENDVWEVQPGDEEELWLEATQKVLFVLKEYNGNTNKGEGADIRCFSLRLNQSGADNIVIDSGINKVLASWLYGFWHIEGGKAPAYNLVKNADLCDFIKKTPFAWVNCKKEAGGSRSTESVIKSYTNKYRVYIKEQLLLLDADIIVCAGTYSFVEKIITEIYGQPTKPTEHSLLYFKDYNKVVLTPNHPSYFCNNTESKYNDLMAVYEQFLSTNQELVGK